MAVACFTHFGWLPLHIMFVACRISPLVLCHERLWWCCAALWCAPLRVVRCASTVADGVGYSLTAVKEPGCNTMVIRDLIKRHVPSAKTLSNVGAEISFQLPLDQSSHFPAMLTELDNNLHALRLETYGISVTTMEEVFLKVAQHGDKGFREQQRTKRSNSLSRPLSTGSAGPASSGGARGSIGSPGARGSLRLYQQEQQQQQQLSSDSNTVAVGAARGAAPSIRTRAHQRLFCTHFGALFQKRVRYFLRDKKVCTALAGRVGMGRRKWALSYVRVSAVDVMVVDFSFCRPSRSSC